MKIYKSAVNFFSVYKITRKQTALFIGFID